MKRRIEPALEGQLFTNPYMIEWSNSAVLMLIFLCCKMFAKSETTFTFPRRRIMASQSIPLHSFIKTVFLIRFTETPYFPNIYHKTFLSTLSKVTDVRTKHVLSNKPLAEAQMSSLVCSKTTFFSLLTITEYILIYIYN